MKQDNTKILLISAEVDEKFNILGVDIESTTQVEEAKNGITTNRKVFQCFHCCQDLEAQIDVKMNSDYILDCDVEEEEDAPPEVPIEEPAELDEICPDVFTESHDMLEMTESLPMDIFEQPSLEHKLIKVAEDMEERSNTQERLFTCPECGEIFKSKYSYRMHKNIHTNKFECTICKASHSKNERLRAHLKRDHSDEEQLQHAQNIAKLRKADEEKSHEVPAPQEIDTEKKVTVPLDTVAGVTFCCNTDFGTIDELFQHFKSVHGDDYFTCGICGKQLKSKKTFKHHVVRVHVEKTDDTLVFPCTQSGCDAKYMLQRDLNHHVAKKHGIKQRRETCVICDQTFESNRSLINHLQVHETNRPYKCDICEKGFHRMSALKEHMLTHTQHKKFSCSVCDQKYLRKSYLIVHERIHTGERPYACTRSNCEKRFYDRGSLRQHRLMHDRNDSNLSLQLFGVDGDGDQDIMLTFGADLSDQLIE